MNPDAAAPQGRVADEAFVRELYASHGRAVYRYALSLADGDVQRAEDLTQETFLRAWRNPGSLEGNPPRPWLFTVTRNLATDYWRACKRRPPETSAHALDSLAVDGEAEALRAAEARELLDVLSTLRREHREVLIETYYRGRSVAEAAAALGIPAGTVKSRTFYALRELRRALEARGLAP